VRPPRAGAALALHTPAGTWLEDLPVAWQRLTLHDGRGTRFAPGAGWSYSGRDTCW
jgi:hypothetical protein